jgi:hypothetical protein
MIQFPKPYRLKYRLAIILLWFGVVMGGTNVPALEPEIIRTKDGKYLC